MFKPFLPEAWFWKHDDGRIYSSKVQAIVAADDPNYVGWLAANNHPTRWPVDNAGAQTRDALLDVVSRYGLTVPA